MSYGKLYMSILEREQELGPLETSQSGQGRPWQHWQMAGDAQGVVWLALDEKGREVNTITQAVLDELNDILDKLDHDQPKGLVLRSAKRTNFCVGADINQFQNVVHGQDITDQLRKAHEIVGRLADISIPTIAIIHGNCLGGGLELALCCDHRLAIGNARMGLPEILLGLHPGLGGTARLTSLIDPLKAMTLMLTGRSVDANRAKALGLVDKVIEERHVLKAVDTLVNKGLRTKHASLKNRLLATKPARRLEARQMRSKTAEKVNMAHYPAPEALIALWEDHGEDIDAMLQAEVQSFAKLLQSSTAQNLIRVFSLREAMKRAAKTGAEAFQHIHVIGAGSMGRDIAAWCSYKGLQVTIFDRDFNMVARAVKSTAEMCAAKHLPHNVTREVLDRLIPDRYNLGVASADLVIEAVPEEIGIKQTVYSHAEAKMRPDALLATNTSSIPLEELAKQLKKPEQFVGLHFFNPVSKMQLVEVVGHRRADQQTIANAKAFVGQIDRLPVEVASSAGFLVNRILSAYLLEAMQMVDEGVPPEQLDAAAEDFGMPVGPIELADRVGLDICLHVAETLSGQLSFPEGSLPGKIRELVEKDWNGLKSGQGFYRWQADKPEKQKDNSPVSKENIDRLILPMINSCVACLREGVIVDPELLDGAMVFGAGFAPFRGGPLHYVRKRGSEDILTTLERFTEKYGERFRPDPGWQDLRIVDFLE
ncbi:MAG: enoyl-CoA hydratase/isomerase family protein [Deltaproteobacteria bacterium]|jgi:3-hydroxyacyl-CoA dehydrogenase/enoyl-CoA hydratase/3-hydroxybutyryl-CoA epimerase|nr:enoyl-CoA hydratase/isomerase family protein [Deltaproteobacteria bacterium]